MGVSQTFDLTDDKARCAHNWDNMKILMPQSFHTITESIFGRLSSQTLENTTLILTTQTQNYDFLEIQAHQLEKHIKFPFIFLAGIDLEGSISTVSMTESEIRERFVQIGEKTKTLILEIPKEIHTKRKLIFPDKNLKTFGNQAKPANRCADSLQFLLAIVPWWKFGSLLFIDGDMFPVNDLQAPLVSEKNLFRGIPQNQTSFKRTVDYFWGGYFWIHNSCPFHHLLNFQNGFVNRVNTDVGGGMSHFANSLRYFGFPYTNSTHLSSGCWDSSHLDPMRLDMAFKDFIRSDGRNGHSGSFYSELYDEVFFHYRAGGNWTGNLVQDEEKRRSLLREILISNS